MEISGHNNNDIIMKATAAMFKDKTLEVFGLKTAKIVDIISKGVWPHNGSTKVARESFANTKDSFRFPCEPLIEYLFPEISNCACRAVPNRVSLIWVASPIKSVYVKEALEAIRKLEGSEEEWKN